jgi:hypothetical protein
MLTWTIQYRSLSNIILVDKTTNPKLLPCILSKDTYQSMKQDFIDGLMRSIKFGDKLYKRAKRLLDVSSIIRSEVNKK